MKTVKSKIFDAAMLDETLIIVTPSNFLEKMFDDVGAIHVRTDDAVSFSRSIEEDGRYPRVLLGTAEERVRMLVTVVKVTPKGDISQLDYQVDSAPIEDMVAQRPEQILIPSVPEPALPGRKRSRKPAAVSAAAPI
ncbi:MAG TPA: hypothetical protein VHB73_00450 [Alphaproteobacteria bacterium]|nr:hypothetical protein [Alphaproteobacteria bacterium]